VPGAFFLISFFQTLASKQNQPQVTAREAGRLPSVSPEPPTGEQVRQCMSHAPGGRDRGHSRMLSTFVEVKTHRPRGSHSHCPSNLVLQSCSY
jgi:hypothetical protein